MHPTSHLETPDLHQLRSWHRNQDLPAVIDALSQNRSAISPPEKTLLALALTMNGQADQDLLQEAAAQTPDETDPLWLSDVAGLSTGRAEQ